MVVPEQVGDLDAVKLEESLMQTWKEENTFQQQVESRRSGEPFLFLEGPPTANGKPGIHHVVARTYKDLVCRWKEMEGFLVERKGGWDTHGLPVEIEVQKRLDLMSNQDILEFGMEAFNDESGHELRLRIGLHRGPAVAGVIGTTKFAYDLWGESVNLASRLESSGQPGRIHVSAAFRAGMEQTMGFETRGEVDLKGVGPTRTHWLVDPRS